MIVHANGIRRVHLVRFDHDLLDAGEGRMVGQFLDHQQAMVAEPGDAALQVQDRIHAADIDGAGRITTRLQPSRQLRRAFLVRAMRQADENMAVGFADVAAVERAGRFDAFEIRIVAAQGLVDRDDLALPAVGAGPRDHYRIRQQHRGVLDEGAVGITRVGRQHRQFQPAIAQDGAITLVLHHHLRQRRHAEVHARQAVGVVRAGQTDDGVAELAHYQIFTRSSAGRNIGAPGLMPKAS